MPAIPTDAAERLPERRWGKTDQVATTVLLVRHGSTEHSLEDRFSGRNDLPLDAAGRGQAAAVAGLVGAGERVDVVLSSPLRRARETAEAIAARTGGQVEIAEDLIELDFGDWEGHTFAEVERAWPAELTAWLARADAAPPGGEAFAAVTARMQRLLADVLTRHAGRRVVAVSHVTPIKTALRLALGAPHEAIFRFHLDTASLSVVDYYADGECNVRVLNRAEQLH